MKRELIEVAAGRRRAQLVLKNAEVINVFTGEMYIADVAIEGGYIAGVGKYDGRQERDCTGMFLAPGFIDAHLHIESTMVLPAELVRMALPSGTTTMVADPHEIVNVCGAKGMQFMLNASENLPCNLYYMLPSSVPSTPFETAGAEFAAADMAPFYAHPRVLGLGEVMCFTDVVAAKPGILNKINTATPRPVDGHAPGLSGKALQAYAAAGVRSEHESTTFDEALEKARAGMAVLVREGSAAHNLTTLVGGLLESGVNSRHFMFCTDDKHLEDIGRDGHVRWNVKMAVDMGMPAVQAVQMATINAARHYNLQDIGAIAPGYKADIVLLSSLKAMEVVDVYKDGVPAAQALAAIKPFAPPPDVLSTVKCKAVTPADLMLRAKGDMHVIEMVPYQLETRHLVEPVPGKQGVFTPNESYSKLCVVERHGQNGNIAVAPLKGYGIQGGAIATSVAHDSHNIIAVGDNDKDIALAINHLREMGGGYVLVQNGRVAGDLPLPVAGIMSDAPATDVQYDIGEILQKAAGMGIPYYLDPFISLSFLALPVIPALRLTDRGLFDVNEFKLL